MSENKKFAAIESTVNWDLGDNVIRVWRSETELKDDYDNRDLWKCATELARWSRREIAEELAKLPRVSAVEVRNRFTGVGVVVYPEWP